MRGAHRTVALLFLASPLVVHAAQGDLSMPVLVGTSVWSYTYAQDGQPAKTTTISDRFVLIEAIGLSYAATDRLRLGFTVQFSEALTNPPPTSSFTGFSIAPTVGYNFWGPFTVSVGPNFILRRGGVSEFGFALNANLFVSLPLGGGVAFVGGLSFQNLLTPMTNTVMIPFGGLSFKLGSLAEQD
jgi:hypothetical protein